MTPWDVLVELERRAGNLVRRARKGECWQVHAVSSSNRSASLLQDVDVKKPAWDTRLWVGRSAGGRQAFVTPAGSDEPSLAEACELLRATSALAAHAPHQCSTESERGHDPDRGVQVLDEGEVPLRERVGEVRAKVPALPLVMGLWGTEVSVFASTCAPARRFGSSYVGVRIAVASERRPLVLSRFAHTATELDLAGMNTEADLWSARPPDGTRPLAAVPLVLTPTATAALLASVKTEDVEPVAQGLQLPGATLIDDPAESLGLKNVAFDAFGRDVPRRVLGGKRQSSRGSEMAGTLGWTQYGAGPLPSFSNLSIQAGRNEQSEDAWRIAEVNLVHDVTFAGTQRMRLGNEIRLGMVSSAVSEGEVAAVNVDTVARFSIDQLLSGVISASRPRTFAPGEAATGGSWVTLDPSGAGLVAG